MDVIMGFTFKNAVPPSFGTRRLRLYTTLDCQSKIKDGFSFGLIYGVTYKFLTYTIIISYSEKILFCP